ncbi:hypothetical protein [Arvimicrobium flavum]|uniref:hypothetical protein n=1 Tax=Arvimicrobium flavum TaxID=3393320 RepID=UPI00237BB69F|nr:hypothetical protein [Mesorhizobium shangrilense]
MTSRKEIEQAAFVDSYARLKQRVQAIAAGERVADPARRARSLQTCHRWKAAPEVTPLSGRSGDAYVPELSAQVEEDGNITDGARRCVRRIAELAYRRARRDRAVAVTVSYLAKGLRRCERTVQRYLRQLEAAGYIRTEVVMSGRSRMSFGLMICLLEPLFAAHHRKRWPGAQANAGVTAESQNKRFHRLHARGWRRIPVESWAMRCMDGVFRAFMQSDERPVWTMAR